jgi:hypothetical protein
LCCFDQCTKKQKGRLIERSQYADVIYQNKVRIETIMKYTEDDKPLWNTHMVKRQWGFYYIMTKKTIKHASADD